MFVFWGDGSQEAMSLVDAIRVRSTENFNWTFIFILAVVFYVYWSEFNRKNYEAIYAGFALYGVHWLYEIANAVIGHVFGYPLWSVSNASTTYILLIGVCWELSMMFSLAGIISFKMLPHDRSKRYFAKDGKGGVSCKLVGALEMALLFALSSLSWPGRATTPSSGSTSGGACCPCSSRPISPSSWQAIMCQTWSRKNARAFCWSSGALSRCCWPC